MPMQWLCRMALLACLAVCMPLAHADSTACPPRVRLAYTDAPLPPYVLGQGETIAEPPGLFIQWARAALVKMGCLHVATEVRLPYNRILNSMEAGSIDMRVTGGYRPDITGIMVFPMEAGSPSRAMAVAEAGTMLYVVKDAPAATWDGKTVGFTGTSNAIGTVRGHYTEKLLQSMKWTVDSAPTWESNTKKLLLGRVAAIVGPDSVVDALPERSLLKVLEPPVAVDLYFAPVSHPFYEAYPRFTQRFWLEICRESRATFKRLPACSVAAEGQ